MSINSEWNATWGKTVFPNTATQEAVEAHVAKVNAVVNALRQTVFALETVANLTGNDAVRPYVTQAKDALAAFEAPTKPLWVIAGDPNRDPNAVIGGRS